jgi:hypothetical protein
MAERGKDNVCPCCGKPLKRVHIDTEMAKKLDFALEHGLLRRYKNGFLVNLGKGWIWVKNDGQFQLENERVSG